MPRRLRFLAAQVGKKRVLSALLAVSDIPGDHWAVTKEHAWRTGTQNQNATPSQLVIRARDAGSITARRHFGQTGTRKRISVLVTSAASEEDAQALVEQAKDTFQSVMKNFGAMDLVRSERTIDGIEVPGADDVWCHEDESTQGISDYIDMYVTGRVGEFMFLVHATALPGGWNWEDAIALAARQAQRLHQPPR